ncbi:hypothetical protein S1361_00945 [Streptomyces cyanogenus]|uniref:LysR substrate-binding domain-containing protein n=2 Tax=Streptomyces cyanogenus TaxID=80860 RepID=A0ABX7TI56_STRCY|nr:hypothetical protein S1361_00945 [Streptomyces cyanogenus]
MLAMIRAGLAVGLIPATLLGPGPEGAGVETVVLALGGAPLYRELLVVSRSGALPLVDELVTLLSGAMDSAQSLGGLTAR